MDAYEFKDYVTLSQEKVTLFAWGGYEATGEVVAENNFGVYFRDDNGSGQEHFIPYTSIKALEARSRKIQNANE